MKKHILQSSTTVALATIAVLLAGCHHTHQGAARDDSYRGTGYAASNPAAAFDAEGTVVNLAPLTEAPDASVFAGRRVQCSAPVTRVLDPQNILVEGQPGRSLCVHLRAPDQGLHKGDMVAFAGEVKRLSTTARAVIGMSDRGSTAILDQTIFIDTQEVQIIR